MNSFSLQNAVKGILPTLPNLTQASAGGQGGDLGAAGSLSPNPTPVMPLPSAADPNALPYTFPSPNQGLGPSYDAPPPSPMDAQPSKIGDLSSLQYSIASSIAAQAKNKSSAADFFSAAQQGMTPEEYEQNLAQQAAYTQDQAQQQQMAGMAGSVAQDTAHLDDDQFQKVMDGLKAELAQNQQPMPQYGGPGPVNPIQAALAGVSMMIDKYHAVDIGASTLGADAQISKDAYTRKVQQWVAEGQRHAENLKTYGEMADLLSKRQMNAQDIASREKIWGMRDETSLQKTTLTGNYKIDAANIAAGKMNLHDLQTAYFKGGSQQIRELARQRMITEGLGDPGPAAPPTAKETSDYEKGLLDVAERHLDDAKTKTEDQTRQGKVDLQSAQIANLKATTGLSNDRAAYVVKQTATWDDESRAKVGLAWKQVDNMNSLIGSRAYGDAIKGKQIDLASTKQQVDLATKPVGDALELIHKQNSDLNTAIQGLQKSITSLDPNEDGYADKVKGLNSQIDADRNQLGINSIHYGDLQTQLIRARKNVVERTAASNAIAAGADPEKVKAQYKKNTGEDF